MQNFSLCTDHILPFYRQVLVKMYFFHVLCSQAPSSKQQNYSYSMFYFMFFFPGVGTWADFLCKEDDQVASCSHSSSLIRRSLLSKTNLIIFSKEYQLNLGTVSQKN